jgi:hypothetical protein
MFSESTDALGSHHAERLVKPKSARKIFWLLILDTPEHVDSEKPNRQIDLGSPLYQLFSKRDFYFIKCS